MTRSGSYGQSFALKHLHEGRVDEALAEAERALAAAAAGDPEPVLDRAQVQVELGRWEAALEDLRRAVELDRAAMVLDDSVVDDTLFAALLGWARQEEAAGRGSAAVDIMARYAQVMPAGEGTHHDDVARWTRRFQGHVDTWVKTHDD